MASITVLFILPSLFKRCKKIIALLLPFIGSLFIKSFIKVERRLAAIAGIGFNLKFSNSSTVSSLSLEN